MPRDGETGQRSFRIFLSSTSEDLADYRTRVASVIERLGQETRRMETFVATPQAALPVCQTKAASADALVVCVAHRYGWVPRAEEQGDGKKSVTWYEVEAALKASKPVFAFVVDPEFAWAGAREQDGLLKAKNQKEILRVGSAVRQLAAFKAFLDRSVTRDTFTTPEDLAEKVATSLFPWLLEQALSVSEAARSTASEAAPLVDVTTYLEDLIDRTDHINISGIATQHAQGALRYSIERLYTPLSSRGIRAGDLAREGLLLEMRHERVALADLLPRYARLLIEGQPGAGKTTFLRFAACMLARDALFQPCPGGDSWCARHLGLEADGGSKIPVFLLVADLVSLLTAADAPRLRNDNRQWLLDLLARSCQEDRHAVTRDHWEKLLRAGDAVLLLDGLDEAADEILRARIFDIIRDAQKKWQCRIVVSSRPIETAPLREMGFHPAVIEPFEEQEIRAFIGHWVAALHAVEQPWQGGEAGRYADSLTEAIVGRSRVRRLAANPVMLTCLCVVHWNEGQLPEGRSRVYRAVLRWLIAARGRLREAEGFSDLFAWRAFARLALAMTHTTRGKRSVVDLESAAVAIEPILAREFQDLSAEERRLRARRWLTFECLGSGVVEEVDGRRLRFWHLTFQEFLAALQLAWRGDGEDPEDDWWPLVREHLDHAQWRETVELLPGCLLDEGGVGRVDRLLGRVLALRGEEAGLATEARVAAILGRLMRTVRVLKYKPSAEISAAYEQALQKSMAIFELAGAAQVPVKTRIAVAEALGKGGDPRLAPGVDHWLPVPGLEDFRLGKYPVTVEEYQRFVEGRGYEEAQHWSVEGWELKEKESWSAPESWVEQLEHPNRPVTGVSWWEAESYCRWLADQRGIAIRLPTSEEWEKAATSEQGEYPWGGEEPDEERVNFAPDFKSNVGSPTPVGIYPLGNGPFEHCDLGGNVWEWCVDETTLPDIENAPWDKDEPGRVLRGGGWSLPAGLLRAASRRRSPASYRLDDVGFRVSAAPASS